MRVQEAEDADKAEEADLWQFCALWFHHYLVVKLSLVFYPVEGREVGEISIVSSFLLSSLVRGKRCLR